MIPQPQGGATRRPGTIYVKTVNAGHTTSGAYPARLIPFVYAVDEAYCVEITWGSIRIINVSDGTVIVPSGSGTMYDYTQIGELQYVQIADILYIVHGDQAPTRIVRSGLNSFSFNNMLDGVAAFDQVKRFPYRVRNVDQTITVTPSALTGTITLTASSGIFNIGHIGSAFKITHASVTGAVIITGYTNSTHVTANVQINFGSATASYQWEEAAWSDYRGWPGTIALFENRLVYGGSESKPDTLWGSGTGNYDHLMASKLAQDDTTDVSGLNYYGAAANTDPLALTIASPQVNQIQWLSSRQVLQVGTYGSEHVAQSADPTLTFGALSLGQREQTSHGSLNIMPAKASNATIFIQRDGLALREMSFNFESDVFECEDISFMAEHMPMKVFSTVYSQIRELAWSQTDYFLWVCDTLGGLFGVLRQRKQGIAAWAYQVLGGVGRSAPSFDVDENPKVFSVCCIPNRDTFHDDLWVCVGRYIGGAMVYYVERMVEPFAYDALDSEGATGENSAIYVDSAKIYEGVATTTITGLAHLEGQTVGVLADGFVIADKTVASGQITLTRAASNVVVGLKYTSKIKTMPIDAGSVIGSALGTIGRIDRVVVDFHRTVSAKVGTNEDDAEQIEFRSSDQPNDEPSALFTGKKSVSLMTSPDIDQQVYIECDQPVPMTVISVMARGDTRDQ
jgi:hypothetical protein